MKFTEKYSNYYKQVVTRVFPKTKLLLGYL